MKRWQLIVMSLVILGLLVGASFLLGQMSEHPSIPQAGNPPAPAPASTVHPQNTGKTKPVAQPAALNNAGARETTTSAKNPAPAQKTPTVVQPAPSAKSSAATPTKPQQANAAPPFAAQAPANPARPGGQPRGQFASRNMPTFALMRLFHGIGQLEDDEKTALTPAQAKAILAIVTPLRKQPTLTPEQAAQTQKQLEAQLTPAQLAAAQARPSGQGWRGGPGGPGGAGPNGAPWRGRRGGGQPGAAPGGNGQGNGWRPGAGPGGPGGAGPGRRGPGMFGGGMENFNPFYVSEDTPSRMAQRMQDTFDALEAKANQ